MRLSKGILVEHSKGKLLLDPGFKAADGIVLISHAHSDHVRRHKSRVLATEQTLRIAGISGEAVAYGTSFEEKEFQITLLNAAHVPGSAMILVEDGQSMLYTGDFRPRESVFGKASPIECDTLIVESTYGIKSYSFPDPEEEYAKIREWASMRLERGESILLGAYALGKAQEVIKTLNTAGITPVVHPRVAEVTEKTGMRLSYFSSLSEEGTDMLAGQFVAVVPPRMVSEETRKLLQAQSKTRVNTAIASGQTFYHADKVFRLSGHADYTDIINFVEACSPKRVYTVHGYARELANSITNELGIPAEPL